MSEFSQATIGESSKAVSGVSCDVEKRKQSGIFPLADRELGAGDISPIKYGSIKKIAI